MRLMPAFTRAALAAVIAAAAPVTGASAGAMPPEYADPAPQRVAVPATPEPEPAPAPRPLEEPAALVPAIDAPPLPPSALTVTYAEDVGLFSRRGYEDVKEDASLYCAQYGRVAALDTRFEVGEEWYVRFDCVIPR